ncbi:hypothetical protein [Streptomyces sp. NPDC051569]|uniref:hypothetical protein n=1 Tax=Streptomyces sp. NPDC051569 TaxID=3365661 RepID=UPI0037B64A39
MAATDVPTDHGTYIGATSAELSRKTTADKLAGGVSQQALFLRRGNIALYTDRLVLMGWNDAGDLVLRRADIRSARARFTELYGRFIGGLLNRGKPLILDTTHAGEIYLLINRREFIETTDDLEWVRVLNAWLAPVS